MKFSVITPTHRPDHLAEAYASLKAQSYPDWEWVVFCNQDKGSHVRTQKIAEQVRQIVGADERVRVELGGDPRFVKYTGVGAVKKAAFALGRGDVLVELDHDDLLTPECLAELARAFEDPSIGFAYSDWADFEHSEGVHQGTPTYRERDTRQRWVANGFEFYETEVERKPGLSSIWECVHAFEPSALALSLIFWAPNHVRAWRRSVYEAIGGHSADWALCDDHELLLRTYQTTKMAHIEEPLYLYRTHAGNTYKSKTDTIKELTYKLRAEWMEKLVLRECELNETLSVELVRQGSLTSDALMTPVYRREKRNGWTPIEVAEMTKLAQDAVDRGRGNVGAFMANDTLQLHDDKRWLVEAISTVLVPGGHFIAFTPSTDGRGAFMDPRHKSYWNEASFWYWTRARLHAQLYGNRIEHRFQEVQLETYFPSEWHEKNKISYVKSHLVALKGDYRGRGEVLF